MNVHKSVLAGVAATAAAGALLVGAPAHAAAPTAAHAKGSTYLHGTTRMASFSSRATCTSHAKWEVGQVNKAPAAATLLGAEPDGQTPVQGQELRYTCYPVRTGVWSYLIAYTSKTGAPLASSDRYVDVSDAARDKNGVTVDTENLWLFVHSASKPSSQTTVAACNKYLTATVNTIYASSTLRLITANTGCLTTGNTIGYFAAYTAPNSTGLPGDTVDRKDPEANRMLDTLGYFDPAVERDVASPLMFRTHS